MKKFTVVVVPYRALPCEAETFRINGRDAEKSDFGSQMDRPYSDQEQIPYCCSNNCFEAETYADPLILEKYDITREQFFEIASKLEDEFAVGGCGWCE